LTIAAGDRVPAKASVPVTLAFTTQAALSIGGKITLNYPAGFFAATSPAANAAGTASVATMTATSAIVSNSIVITTAVLGIAANTPFTITLSDLTMGAATAGSTTGITVQTDADTVASAGVASGGIGTRITSLSVAPSSTALATTVSVVITFTTTTAVPIGGTILFSFPTGWFDASATPTANAAGTSSVPTLTATSVIAANTITVTTSVAEIPVGAFTITVNGLKTGPSSVAAGVFSVATSTDFFAAEVASPALGAAGPSTPILVSSATSTCVSTFLLLAMVIMIPL